MEASGSPSISPAPMGGGHDLSILDNMCMPVIGTRTDNTQLFAYPYLKCPQRRLYSAWKIMDIYLRRFAEYWNTVSASLRKLENFSVRSSAIFPHAHLQMSAERSANVCEHLCEHQCGHPQTSLRTSTVIYVDVRMDGCRHLRTSAWMTADVDFHGPKDLLELLPLLCNNLLIICGTT